MDSRHVEKTNQWNCNMDKVDSLAGQRSPWSELSDFCNHILPQLERPRYKGVFVRGHVSISCNHARYLDIVVDLFEYDVEPFPSNGEGCRRAGAKRRSCSSGWPFFHRSAADFLEPDGWDEDAIPKFCVTRRPYQLSLCQHVAISALFTAAGNLDLHLRFVVSRRSRTPIWPHCRSLFRRKDHHHSWRMDKRRQYSSITTAGGSACRRWIRGRRRLEVDIASRCRAWAFTYLWIIRPRFCNASRKRYAGFRRFFNVVSISEKTCRPGPNPQHQFLPI